MADRSRSPQRGDADAAVADADSPPEPIQQDSQSDDEHTLLPEEASRLYAAVGRAVCDTRSTGEDRARRWDLVDDIRREINARKAKDLMKATGNN